MNEYNSSTSSPTAKYQQFIAAKAPSIEDTGFEPGKLPSQLFDFQAAIVQWAVRKGRAAIFADTGLGKTAMQVVWADQVHQHTGGNVLILAPLCVAQQTVQEGQKFDIEVNYCRKQSDVVSGINITNYEMLDHFDTSAFVGVVLDESSILKSYTGKIKQSLITRFIDTPYRLACTATPAPNDHLELGNHAEFLGIMPSFEMIMRFFINDSMEAGGYRLKQHARSDFWQWVASWAVCISNPDDIGFDGDRFILPELNERTHVVPVDDLPPADGELFRTIELSATSVHKEGRITAGRRSQQLAAIVNASSEQWIIWVNTNYEADSIAALIPDAIEVRGSDSIQKKTVGIMAFTNGDARILITKPSVAGFGMNWQHCHNVGFVGLNYSYEMYYQAIRRCWRFGQQMPVNVHVMAAESETAILKTIHRKQEQHKEMKKEMVSQISANFERKQIDKTTYYGRESGSNWTLHHGDCVHVCRDHIETGSIDFCIFSPPFSNLYVYSDNAYDMGNCVDDEEFLDQYRFLANELLRVMRPGRLVAIHCKDLPLYRNRDGAMGLRPFPDELLRVMQEAETDADSSARFVYHSRITIWKDPVIEMQRTKNHGLLYKQLCKNSAASRQGMADYMIIVRKWTDAIDDEETPVNSGQPERFFDYVGMSKPAARELAKGRDAKERQRLFSIAVWQRYASPVWFDIQQTNVLNIKAARDSQDEKHIAPLQLDVIERCVELWSNPGDLVLSPFAGLGSEGVQSLRMNRRFVGAELKESYFKTAISNLKEAGVTQDDLFAEIA